MLRTALSATALATTAIIAAAVPAHAAKLVIRDATGDVYSVNEDASEITPVGTRANVDVKRTVITHTGRYVTLKATYTDLKKNSEMLALGFGLRTNEGLKRDVGVFAWPGMRRGESSFTRFNSGKELACKGLTHKIDYVANTVAVTLPRTCLSAPRWVQVQPLAFTGTSDASYVDDVQRTDVRITPTWSAKVRRG